MTVQEFCAQASARIRAAGFHPTEPHLYLDDGVATAYVFSQELAPGTYGHPWATAQFIEGRVWYSANLR